MELSTVGIFSRKKQSDAGSAGTGTGAAAASAVSAPAPQFVQDATKSPKMTVTLRTERVGEAAAPVSLIKQAGVSFEKKVEASVVSLKKEGISGTRWAVIGLLDQSGSMRPFYKSGVVQEIVERALAWSASVDNDGSAPFGGFGFEHQWLTDVNLSNVIGIVDREGWGCRGTTNLSASLDAALEVAKESTDPVYLFVVTDGSPDSRSKVKRQIMELSQYPMFIKFLVVGNDQSALAFMEELDDMSTGRLIDNVDKQHIPDPTQVSDAEFAEMMTEETGSFLAEAKRVGLVR